MPSDELKHPVKNYKKYPTRIHVYCAYVGGRSERSPAVDCDRRLFTHLDGLSRGQMEIILQRGRKKCCLYRKQDHVSFHSKRDGVFGVPSPKEKLA